MFCTAMIMANTCLPPSAFFSLVRIPAYFFALFSCVLLPTWMSVYCLLIHFLVSVKPTWLTTNKIYNEYDLFPTIHVYFGPSHCQFIWKGQSIVYAFQYIILQCFPPRTGHETEPLGIKEVSMRAFCLTLFYLFSRKVNFPVAYPLQHQSVY